MHHLNPAEVNLMTGCNFCHATFVTAMHNFSKDQLFETLMKPCGYFLTN